MRTLMMLASVLLLAVGTFCMANSSVAFVSFNFLIGVAVLFLGICELLVNRFGVMIAYETHNEVNAEGLIAIILGVVFLSGEIQEAVAVTALFALWTTIEGVNSISSASYDIRSNSSFDNILLVIGGMTTLFGVYMFFNLRLLNIPTVMMVGIALFLIGVNRFKIAMAIEYKAPEFISGSEEKLAQAKADEKAAMQKAKEAIRETKEAQNRISKITKEMAKEESLKSRAEGRRSAERE